jgi:hypothetical protein
LILDNIFLWNSRRIDKLLKKSLSLPAIIAPELDFAGLGRIAGDVYQAVEEPVGIFCTLPVMR